MKGGAAAGDRSLEARLVEHADTLGLLAIAAGFVLSLYHSAATYLNPDEAQHVCAAAAPTFWGALVRSRESLAHPPLLAMVEHAVVGLGRSEWLLRLPSMLACSAAQWLVFKWLRRAADAASALAALVFLVGSPAMLSASTQVRQYGLLLFGTAGALYTMERMLAQTSTTWVGMFAVSLYWAILAHYSAAWIVLTLAVYVALRLRAQRGPARLVWLWGATQAGAATLYAWLYVTQLSLLRGSSMEAIAMSTWLGKAYYRPGEESALVFIGRTLRGSFAYCAGGLGLGAAAAALFAIGTLVVALRMSATQSRLRRDHALLFVLPLVIGCGGALARLLPFGRTRHVSFVLPFVAAGVGIGIARLLRGRLLAVSLLSVLALPAWLWSTRPAGDPARMRRADLMEALEYLRAVVAPDTLLVVDDQTHYVLRAYLDPSASSAEAQPHGVKEVRLGAYRVACIPQTWSLRASDALSYLEAISHKLELPPDQPVWLMSTGWNEAHIDTALPRGQVVQGRHFGRISVVQVRPRARSAPGAPGTSR